MRIKKESGNEKEREFLLREIINKKNEKKRRRKESDAPTHDFQIMTHVSINIICFVIDQMFCN